MVILSLEIEGKFDQPLIVLIRDLLCPLKSHYPALVKPLPFLMSQQLVIIFQVRRRERFSRSQDLGGAGPDEEQHHQAEAENLRRQRRPPVRQVR